jgi:hypothetical protein
MNKQDYLVKKGQIANPANGALWIIKSTRSAVVMYEAPVWEIRENMGSVTYHDDNGNVTKKTTFKRYKLKDVEPYEMDVLDDTKTGEHHGYGTGFGDLWGWSYLASPDKDIALKLYEDEKLRVQTKYGLIF